MIRDTSANSHASQKMFAKKIISKDVTDKEVADIMAAKDKLTDIMGVMQHHDAVTGTEKQHVANEYLKLANEATANSDKVYSKFLSDEVLRLTGTKLGNLQACTGSNNDTVQDCPVNNHTDAKSFIVVAHNTKATNFTQLVRVKLPKVNYKAQVWNKKEKKFLDTTDFDVFEQMHFVNDQSSKSFKDYEMFIDLDLEPNEVTAIKIEETE